jgi:SAM-dependent methyltransferase
MGQGRNAVALARKGWDVTGIDMSAEGLAVSKANAALAGVTITAVHSSDKAFDYGRDRWDLIAVIYGPDSTTDEGFVQRLQEALRPGGIVVVESFASPRGATRRRPVDIDPADLLRAFAGFRLLRFEDADGVSEWDPQPTALVRMIAQKRR